MSSVFKHKYDTKQALNLSLFSLRGLSNAYSFSSVPVVEFAEIIHLKLLTYLVSTDIQIKK